MSNTDQQIRKELDCYWRRAKKARGPEELWDVLDEASGLLDYETCGAVLVIKPNFVLFGKTRHSPIIIDGKNNVETFLAAEKRAFAEAVR